MARHRVLVAYATAAGSTRGVAERIAGDLTRAGHRVDLVELGNRVEVGSHDAVVVGSAVHDRRWLPVAEGFLAAPAGAPNATPPEPR